MGKKEKKQEISTFISSSVCFQGEITSTAGLRIDGKLKGRVKSGGSVIIGHTGEVEADIFAQSVFIDGKLNGNVKAKNLIEITRRGVLYGDIGTPNLITEPGAFFEGICKMGSRNISRDAGESSVLPVLSKSMRTETSQNIQKQKADQ